jgi:hypothetical protein
VPRVLRPLRPTKVDTLDHQSFALMHAAIRLTFPSLCLKCNLRQVKLSEIGVECKLPSSKCKSGLLPFRISSSPLNRAF